MIGRATLANVERLLEEATGVLHGLAVCRADAVAPVMALAQSLDLLFIEFHVLLVPARAAACLLLLLYTRDKWNGFRGAGWGASKRLRLY